MKEASRIINIVISDLPDDFDEDDLEFVVDTSKVEIEASLKGVDIPRSKIDIDVEEDVYIREI